jgi:anti-sigma factor RsiW
MKRLWEYLDGELRAEEVAELREHLALCARCYPEYRFRLGLLAVVARAAAASKPRQEFVRRLHAAMASVEA